MLVAAVLGALFIPTPYVLIQPASAPGRGQVSVGGDTEAYETDGDVLFTTVYVDDATLFGLLRGSLDDAIEVRSSDEVYGDRGATRRGGSTAARWICRNWSRPSRLSSSSVRGHVRCRRVRVLDVPTTVRRPPCSNPTT
ncbi:MAG: hypothetical protein H6517_07695 [Microthrixaceae bacterium]|nr:hypothetical protein [Microthrixaceae bacterium]